jgi:hypothetical protein
MIALTGRFASEFVWRLRESIDSGSKLGSLKIIETVWTEKKDSNPKYEIGDGSIHVPQAAADPNLVS